MLSKDDPSPLAPESDDEKAKEADEEGQGQEGRGKDAAEGEDRPRGPRPADAGAAGAAEELRRPAGRQGGHDLPRSKGRRSSRWTTGRAARPPPRPSTGSTWRSARPRSWSTGRATSPSRTTARSCSTARRTTGSWSAPARRPSRATGRSSSTASKSASTRGPSGGRSTARCCRDRARLPLRPGFHGYDLKAAWDEARAATSTALGSRHDLNYLLDELLAGLSPAARLPARRRRAAGREPQGRAARGRLRGRERPAPHRQDLPRRELEPGLRAPLTQPGAGVKEGEYLLAVNGQELRGEDEVYRLFEGTAGKQTVLKVGPNAGRQGQPRGHRRAGRRASGRCGTWPGWTPTAGRWTS